MRVRFSMATVLLGVVALATAPPLQRRAPEGQGPAHPVVVHPDHMDKSPALRSLPVLPPLAGGHTPDLAPFRRLVGPKSFDPVVQGSPLTPLIASPTMSIDGTSNVNNVLPPDTNGAVGPNHYVQWVNLSFAVYGKGPAGSPPTLLYGPAAGNTLWTGFGGPCESSNNGDPVVRYDHLADRWVMSQLALPNDVLGLIVMPPFYQCIAVSASSDPLGPYYRYQYSFNKLNDYPKLGVWPDAYYMTMNQYSAPNLTFAGQGVVAFDRASMLNGQPASMVYFDLSSVNMNLGGMLPADLDGPPPPAGSPDYYMQFDDDATGVSAVDQLELWRFHVDWSNTANSTFTQGALLPTAPFDSDMCNYAQNCIPQPGTSVGLDALSDRLMYRLQYRNFGDHESLVVNHTVDVDGTNHAGIRWYEVRDPNGSPTIYQQGTYSPDSDNRWMASAAMDSAGDLAIGFSVSGPTTYPSIRYAGRLATDPLGTLAQGETEMMTGSGVQTDSSSRWGDYSMLTVDPADDCTFWYTQEYYAATTNPSGWRTRIGTFSFPSCVPQTSSGPQLTIAATTPTAYDTGLVPGVLTVSRTGDTSQAVTVPYAIAGTAVPGTDYVALSGSVAIPAGAASATIQVVPIDDTPGEPNETVTVTLGPVTGYTIASPESAAVTIVNNDPLPDLVVASFTASTVGGDNATISVSDTTKNQGTGTAAASTTAFYLSTDFILSPDDVLLGTRPVASLAAGAADTATTTLTIPASVATGSYYLIAKADSGSVIPETNENNNTKWTPIAIGPDLIVSTVTIPATAAAGGTMLVGDTTTNRGGGAAPASVTGFYLSTNAVFDASDVFIGSRSVPALNAGASNSTTTALTVPANTPAGSYWVIAVADSTNTVVESVEGNNTRASATITKIGADLTVTAASAPTIAGAGGTIVVTDTTTNAGAGAAGASTTGFYLSANLFLDSSDVLIGSRSVPALAAGASSSGSTSLTIPATTPTGTYYVIVDADYTNQVAESNETNNTRNTLGIAIGPDLTQTGTSTSGTGGAGLPLTITDTTKNVGGGDAGPSTTALYISTSAVFNATSATLIGTHPVPALPAGTSSTATTTVTLPSTLTTGTYFILAVADTGNAIAETSEANNASFGVAVRIGPDLTVTGQSVPASSDAGDTITATSTVTNQGGGAAGASTTYFYLSTNLALDPSDVMVGSRAVGPLGPGQSDTGPASITIPPGTAPGSYFLLIVADGANAVTETNETNNVRGILITVKSSMHP